MEILYPLGTVVKIKDDPSEYTIIGYCPEDESGVHTYIGIDAATGLSVNTNAVCFDNDSIEQTVFLGYSDEESEMFRISLGKTLARGNE